MSDEEKKAIEKIKSFNQYNWEMNNLKGKEFAKPYFESLDTLLNLIEKQSKEIEELEKENWIMRCVDKQYISKDKIKAKIEEINKEMLNEENSLELFYRKKYCKEVLESLLEKE